jgi:hypothetical protein
MRERTDNRQVWQPGTIWDNVAAVVSAIGMGTPAVVLSLARLPWASTDERDAFLREITYVPSAAASAAQSALRMGREPARAPMQQYRDDEPNPSGGLGGWDGWPKVATTATA